MAVAIYCNSYLQSLCMVLQCLLILFQIGIGICNIVVAYGNLGMFIAKGFQLDIQRFSVIVESKFILLHFVIEATQIVESEGDVGMFGAEESCPEFQCLHVVLE